MYFKTQKSVKKLYSILFMFGIITVHVCMCYLVHLIYYYYYITYRTRKRYISFKMFK